MNQKHIWSIMTVGGVLLVFLLIGVLVMGFFTGVFANASFAQAENNEAMSSDVGLNQSGDDDSQSIDNPQSDFDVEMPMSGVNLDTLCDSKNDESLVEAQSCSDVCDCGPEFKYHVVTKYDTLSDISREYGVSVEKIADFNAIDNVNLIYTGSTLRIPILQK